MTLIYNSIDSASQTLTHLHVTWGLGKVQVLIQQAGGGGPGGSVILFS